MSCRYYVVSLGLFYKDINESGLSLWMQTRDEQGSLFGKWEFPGGKIELGETPIEAMRREVHEEVGLEIPLNVSLFPVGPLVYTYENRHIALHPFLVKFDKIPTDKGKWFNLSFKEKTSFLQGEIPAINHQLIDDCLGYVYHLYQMNRLSLLDGENYAHLSHKQE